MDTLNLMKWHQEFMDIMRSKVPRELKFDDLVDLFKECDEQKDMFDDTGCTEDLL